MASSVKWKTEHAVRAERLLNLMREATNEKDGVSALPPDRDGPECDGVGSALHLLSEAVHQHFSEQLQGAVLYASHRWERGPADKPGSSAAVRKAMEDGVLKTSFKPREEVVSRIHREMLSAAQKEDEKDVVFRREAEKQLFDLAVYNAKQKKMKMKRTTIADVPQRLRMDEEYFFKESIERELLQPRREQIEGSAKVGEEGQNQPSVFTGVPLPWASMGENTLILAPGASTAENNTVTLTDLRNAWASDDRLGHTRSEASVELDAKIGVDSQQAMPASSGAVLDEPMGL